MATLAKPVPDTLSNLDIFVLSLVLRGLTSKYELQRHGGVSLGSSTPVIVKLSSIGLLSQQDQQSAGSRLRNRIKITAKGKKALEGAWPQLLHETPAMSIEDALRVADIAKQHGAPARTIAKYLSSVAEQRLATLTKRTDGAIFVSFDILETRAAWVKNLAQPEAKFVEELSRLNTRRPKAAR